MAAAMSDKPAAAHDDETTALSLQYDTPLGVAHTTMQALKDRIKLHYDLASDYYVSLWGEHIHHGYWPTDESKASESKEKAQVNLIQLLLSESTLDAAGQSQTPLAVLDVGCGVGGTSRYLAQQLGCQVTGITISTRQVEIATRMTAAAATSGSDENTSTAEGFLPVGEAGGSARFLELDAEKMGDYFAGLAEAGSGTTTGAGSDMTGSFDVVWISEALSHFPDKALFFQNAFRVLRPGGKLVLADWFKADGLDDATFDADIKPIEDGMLLPPLCTMADYAELATQAGLRLFSGPKDISHDVSKTWELSWGLVQKPALWAYALSQGRDGIAFLQAFRAMRRGYADGSFRYAVMSFEK